MKIEGKRPGLDRALERVEATKTSQTQASRGKGVTSADHIRVSAEARLAREAVQLAQDAPEVRTDAVERAAALLAKGDLGADAEALAETIIDSALER